MHRSSLFLQTFFNFYPTGQNPECYRTYEAIELASIPIIEDVTTKSCNNTSPLNGVSAPYKLLKRYGAPVYYVRNLDEIPRVLDEYRSHSLEERIRIRIRLLEWNQAFKAKMKELFVEILSLLFDLC